MIKKKLNLEAVKALREQTSASINDVRVALEAADGDRARAIIELRKRGAAIAEKRAGRATGQGRVEVYVHHDGRLGAMVEVNCETDFVARTDEFQQFCRELAMHVAAMGPRYVGAEDASAAEREAAVTTDYLLEQPFVKDSGTTVQDLLKALIAKIGENVVIRRFSRFNVGGA